MESTRIEEIKERVRDFTKALRKGGAADIASRIDDYAAGFTDITQVRRSVASIKQQLEHWRDVPGELPDMPVVHVAANRLEDVCTEALRAGVIVPARPSLYTQGRRKLTVVVTALAIGGLVFFVPIVLTMLGVDLNDTHITRELPPLKVLQGDEATKTVSVLTEALEPAVTRGVEVYIAGRCRDPLSGGTTCKAVEAHEFDAGSLPTFEILLKDQAYGVLVAVTDMQVIGRVGTAKIVVEATEDTPPGTYRIPLSAAFIGYTPEHCTPIERMRDKCVRRAVGDDARHDGLDVPTVVVQVQRGDPSRKSSDEQKRAEELARKKQQAEERAEQIKSAVTQIKAVLDDTQAILRKKRYEEVRERVDKLNQLFSPLDNLTIEEGEAEALPVAVAKLRARFESQRDELKAFEERTFEQAFPLLTAAENQGRTEESLLAEVAKRAHVSTEYVSSIYTAHAEQIEKRLEEAKQARLDADRKAREALEQRCGSMPTGTWKSVDTYLKGIVKDARVSTGECLTPRVDGEHCWTINCDFKLTVPSKDLRPDKVVSYTRTFLLDKGRVSGHLMRALQ